MKTQFIWISMVLISVTFLSATVYEDAESPENIKWEQFDGNNSQAEANITYDDELQSHVIKLTGISTSQSTGLKLKGEAWEDSNRNISWKMKYSENFVIYIGVETEQGYKYLKYTSADQDGGVSGNTIHYGLGTSSKNGTWQTIQRDLQADLKEYNSTNNIITINEFKVLGSGMFDDIETNNVIDNAEIIDKLGLWKKFDDDLTNTAGSVNYIHDTTLDSTVISLTGISTNQTLGFKLGNHTGDDAWKSSSKNISWKMKYSENFVIYIGVQTEQGYKYLKYTSADQDDGVSGNTIHYGLGTSSKNDTWQTIQRDLQADLKEYNSTNNIITVNEFKVLGSGMFDDIKFNNSSSIQTCSYYHNHMSSEVAFIGIEDQNLEEIINDSEKRIFCFSPGDYATTDNGDIKYLKLTAKGTETKKRYILLDNDNNEHPARLNKSTNTLARIAFNIIGGSYWVIDRMAYWDGPSTRGPTNPKNIMAIGIDIDSIDIVPSTHNTISRYYMSNVESGIYIYPESNNTTIKNCRLENNATYYKYDQAAIALHNKDMNNTSISNTKILNNEIVNFVDAFQSVNSDSGRNIGLNYEGTTIENNLFYVNSQIYTDGNGTLKSDGNFSFSENAIDLKAGSSNINNPFVIKNNKMWGFRPSDLKGKKINRGFSSKNAPAMTIHYGVKNVKINNNTIFDSAGGIYMSGATIVTNANDGYTNDYSGKDINITNNRFSDIYITTLYLKETKDINITNNFIKNTSYAYTFEINTSNTICINNSIFNAKNIQVKKGAIHLGCKKNNSLGIEDYTEHLIFEFDRFTTNPLIPKKTVRNVIKPE